MPIKVGIIGLGRSGWDLHVHAATNQAGFQIAAVADPVSERRERAEARLGCAAYADASELLASPDVELVVVATPSHTHVEITLEALANGKHVLVEKPMAQTAAQVDQMIQAAERGERLLTCYQPRRLDPGLIAMQRFIADGRVGRPVLIRHSHHEFRRRSDWQTLRRLGGGAIANWGAHTIDQALLLMHDGPIEVFADLQHTINPGDADDFVKVCLRDKVGLLVDLEHSTCSAFPRWEWQVIGTSGAIVATRDRLSVRWLDDELPPLTASDGPAGTQYGVTEQVPWRDETIDLTQQAGYREHARGAQFYTRLYASLRNGAPLLVTPQSVRRQIEIIETARLQAAT